MSTVLENRELILTFNILENSENLSGHFTKVTTVILTPSSLFGWYIFSGFMNLLSLDWELGELCYGHKIRIKWHVRSF